MGQGLTLVALWPPCAHSMCVLSETGSGEEGEEEGKDADP